MAPKHILIISEASDFHSNAVAWALRKKGHNCESLFTRDFPILLGLSVNVGPDDSTGRFLLRGPGVVERAGARRSTRSGSGVRERPCIRETVRWWGASARSSWRAWHFPRPSADIFWVNPLESDVVAQKACQFRSAARAGLKIPETLISNDPAKIRAFPPARRGGRPQVAAAGLLARPR